LLINHISNPRAQHNQTTAQDSQTTFHPIKSALASLLHLLASTCVLPIPSHHIKSQLIASSRPDQHNKESPTPITCVSRLTDWLHFAYTSTRNPHKHNHNLRLTKLTHHNRPIHLHDGPQAAPNPAARQGTFNTRASAANATHKACNTGADATHPQRCSLYSPQHLPHHRTKLQA